MNFTKKATAVAAIGLAMLGSAACSNKSTTSESTNIPKVTKKTTVVFWHGLQSGQEAALKDLTAKFEKQNPKIKVKLEGQGDYDGLQSKLTSTMQSPKNLPTITQAYSDWLESAANNKLLVDLKPYINNTDVGWGSAKASDINPDMLKGATISGKQYGIPFNKSIEVLIYNPDMLKEYGIDKAPQTMAELKEDAKTIYEKSNHKVVGAGFDDLDNYYALGMKNAGENFSSKINFTGKNSKALLDYYTSGIKDGYFRMAGSDKYLYLPYASKKLAMLVTSSSTESWVKGAISKKKMTYAVAPRPSKYTMQQGTDIYMFKQASATQKAAAFKYMKFLTSKKSQIEWAQKTGYIPVNTKAAADSEYTDNKEYKLPAQLTKSTKHLYTIPVIKNSGAAYSELTPIMQNVLVAAQKNQNLDKAYKTGKSKFDASWKQ